MEEVKIPIAGKIAIELTGKYDDPTDATVSLFYDKDNDKAYCRVHWRKEKRIRIDEVTNFSELRFKGREFVNHLLFNGIRISNIYKALGYGRDSEENGLPK